MSALRRLFLCMLALGLLFAAPAARAETYTFGSDLKADANVVEDHGADSAFWPESHASGTPIVAPVGGQVTVVRVKGTVLPDPSGRKNPIPMVHFQTLHPLGDGGVLAELSSAPFYIPIGGDPNTISTYKPLNMCVHKGDYLDFNDIGGNQWWWGNYSGMPFQTFGRVGGSSVNFFTDDAGTNTNTRWRAAATYQDEELLQQMKLVTGSDATDVCPGGYKQHIYDGVDLRDGASVSLRTRTRTAEIRLTCPYESYGGCEGVLRAEATIKGQRVLLGGGPFDTRSGYSDGVEIDISSANVRAIQRARAVTVRLVADSHDDPRHDKRVLAQRALPVDAEDDVPVQTKTTTATIKLRPDKLVAKKKASKKKRKKRRTSRAR